MWDEIGLGAILAERRRDVEKYSVPAMPTREVAERRFVMAAYNVTHP